MQITKASDRHCTKEIKGVARKNRRFVARLCAMVTAFLIATVAWAFSQAAATSVTLTGRVSCAKCGPFEPMHKGYTQWTWALHSVSEGDDIVLVVGNNTYKLQGDQGSKEQLLKSMESKTTVSGDLEGRTLIVQTVSPASKAK
jgi:hypothetical protein